MPGGLSTECLAQGHNGELGACHGCRCGCHTGKTTIPGHVVHAARTAAARARQTLAARVSAREAHQPLPGRLRDALTTDRAHPDTQEAP